MNAMPYLSLYQRSLQIIACISLIAANSLQAVSKAENDTRIRALESEVQAALQQARSIELNQSLIEERLHHLEVSIEKLRRDIASFEQRLQASAASKLSTNASESESLRQWQQQTDRNISNLQQGLQALAGALGSSSTSSKPSTPTSSTHSTYVVKSGDSLEKIARKHNTSVESIQDLNQLKSSKIQVGQKLKLPSSDS